ncbi:MAG: hypothetical protein COA86_09385 [Kangiella sp.]|nr:MAG: hypothetical protein COA86_09385 [Kangiella sp.]
MMFFKRTFYNLTLNKISRQTKLTSKVILAIKVFLLTCAMASSNLYADVLPMPIVNNVNQSADTPKLGLDMQKVEDQYGEPTQRIDAVGEPPITRWIYPTFTVFFEHDKVLHSVIHRS